MANPPTQLAEYAFKPGQSGNPNGRPRKRPITEEYEAVVNDVLPEKERKLLGLPEGTTWGRAIALGRAREALQRGGTLAAKEIREAIEGRATQRIEISSPADRGFEVNVRFEEPVAARKIAEAVMDEVIDVVVESTTAELEGEEQRSLVDDSRK